MARTTQRSRLGKKLYAIRHKSGRFKDIQTYKRAHGLDEGPIYGAGQYTVTKLGLFTESKTAAAALAKR